MSLLFGFHETIPTPKDQSGAVKTLTITTTFAKFNDKAIVKSFDSGILLFGITTTSASSDPSTPHTGLVYYDIYNSNLSKRVTDVRTDSGNYFAILNENNIGDGVGRLLSAYNVPKSCTLTVRLAPGSSRLKRGNTENNSLPKSVPAKPVTLKTTLYYAEITPHTF